MKPPRAAFVALALLLLGPGLLGAQEQPLAAGTDGVPVPKKKKHVQPVYPQEALAQGLRGIVILDLVIDAEGQVAETVVIRSIPGLDEAALAAARQWQYEPVKVKGQPVSVRLTVPITFALKLPEVSRDAGIPELRQGVTPPWPPTGGGGGSAAADVTLDPDGRIGLAHIIEGDEPWSTSLLRALRTWRFRPPREDASVSFRVEAEFVPGSGREQGSVRLRLSGLRESQFFDAPPDEPASMAALEPFLEGSTSAEGPDAAASEALPEEPAPAPETPAAVAGSRPDTPAPPAPEPTLQAPAARPETPAPVAEARPEPLAPPAPEPTLQAPPARPETPAPVAEARPEPPAPPAPEPTLQASAAGPEASAARPETPAAKPETPAPVAEARPGTPAAPTPEPRAEAPAPATTPQTPGPAAPAGSDPTAPPPIEVITAAPPPLPPENGISAIRGVQLEPGVPDLTRGRRPVAPPFARMAGASGVVEIDFSVSSGGVTAVQRASGPEILEAAATQAVESWIFRRTRADRAYLTAVFTYEDDLASAVVKPQPRP